MRYILSTFFLIFICSKGFGQAQNGFLSNPVFKNYSTKDGLSQRSVISIFQDHQGYMWFGTRYGLNKFDGKKFKSYYYNSEVPNSLSNSWVLSIVEDKSYNIWFGTKNGLNKYIPEHDSFERIYLNHNIEKPYDIEIIALTEGQGPFLWIATNQGLHRFNTETYRVLTFKNNRNIPSSLSSNQTSSLLLTKKSDLWICTSETIDQYQPQNNTFLHYSYPKDASPTRTKNYTTTLFEDSNNTIWIGYDKGLAYFDKIEKRFKEYKFKSDTGTVITSAVRKIYEDEYNNLLVGTYDGLFYINLKDKSIYHYKHDKKKQSSLSQNSIYEIYEDSKGDLWFGTWAGGISYLDKHANTFKSYSDDIYQVSLNNNIVSSIVEYRDNELWIGTEGGGLNVLNLSTGKFSYLQHNPDMVNSLSGNNVKALLKDKGGNLWVGTHGSGISKVTYDGQHISYTRYVSKLNDSASLSDDKITCLAEDDNNNIWVGTSGGGLNIYNKALNNFSRIKDSDTLMGGFIQTMFKAINKNKLWVGSDIGLFEIDADSKSILHVDFKSNKEKAFNVKTVISIYQESDEILWIGTEGDGLYKYNIVSKESQRFGVEQGLSDGVIYGIKPNNEELWVSTNNGISRLNIKTNDIKNFNESDGLHIKEFNYGASYKRDNGELIFGGTNGLTMFNPNNIVVDTFIPPVLISSVTVRNRPELKVTETVKSLNLEYNQNDIQFDFVALGFSKANKHEYAYKLNGFDDKWRYVGNNSKATYTNLDHGAYQFEVKAANSDGIWTDKPAVLKVVISPPLWKTWWAYTLYIVLFIVLFFAARKALLVRINEKNALREVQRDKERTEELNKLKLQLFTNISHDFRTPLTLIVGPLKRLMDHTSNDPFIQTQLKGMYRNTNILLQLINQLLDFRKAESGKLRMHFSKGNFVPFIENIKLSFEQLAHEKQIKYTLNYPSSHLELWFDKVELQKTVLNILSNAFKFTPVGGCISIDISKNEKNDTIELKIRDNGKGIPDNQIPFIFDRYFQLGQQHELRTGTGVGLAVAKDIVDLHHGEIKVHSKIGEGTVFIIALPLGNKHINQEQINFEVEEINNHSFLDVSTPEVFSHNVIHSENLDVDKFNKDLPSMLIVEDNSEVRKLIFDLFLKTFNVYQATNGNEGITKAQSKPIDIIISDVMMPVMDGLQFCSAIKTDIVTSHIPVILLTARTSKDMQKSGYETGADIYISKPFEPDLLKMQVENLLKSRLNLIEKFKKDIILKPKELELVSTDEVFLQKAMDIVEEHITDPDFLVTTFAEKMFMSQSVLYRKIKGLTGQSISEFLRTIKLKRAAQLLVKTDMTVTDIAYQIGFNDIKYFRKCFKETFNLTPSQFKKQHQNTNKE
ncbi:two-component regulator propeller domain-containing protein [Aestuariibaculum sediminum]|uniref:histidine kinase n=1 Tax=Aestuariibaculum sediminum TaxID=2770637 RepID=A0A8J6Q3Q3_9FLAO|nr:two-component regulator propeller domain-containing protein [Aestuariibaculum sediminum]MBD0832585.1 response regulator [Aestuariibaculum sediminum]